MKQILKSRGFQANQALIQCFNVRCFVFYTRFEASASNVTSLAWTLTNKFQYFTFAAESSFVSVTERSDHTMDSADASDLRDFLSNNNARMDHQEEQMLATGRAVQALVVQVSELTTQFQHLRSPTKLTSTTSSFNFNEHQTTS